MIDAEWWEYDSAEELAEAVAGDAQFVIESALDARGDAVVAFAGGRTPAAAQALLAKARLKWKNVTIVPTDDRLVPVQDERSNVRALAERFLHTVLRERDGSGWVRAASIPWLTTGFYNGDIPFLYPRRGHLAANGWAVLAALDVSPFDAPPT